MTKVSRATAFLILALVSTCGAPRLAHGLSDGVAPAPADHPYVDTCWENVMEVPWCCFQVLSPFINPDLKMSISAQCCRLIRQLRKEPCWPNMFTPLEIPLSYADSVALLCAAS